MLYTNGLDNADNHTTIMKVNQGSPFVILIARFERFDRRDVDSLLSYS